MLRLRSGVTILLFLICINISIHSQTANFNDIFNIYFEQDFEDNTIGNYLYDDWAEDWNYPQWSDRVIPQEILSNQDAGNGTKVLRWHFPEGGVGPREGGGQWLTDLGGNYNELYLSYKIKFNPGFQWVLGGKIHGLLGEPLNDGNGPPPYDGGFNVLICWDETPGQNIKFYYYHQDQTHDYGDIHLWNQAIETGRWYTVTLRLVMNTVSNDVGNNDGILEGYIDYKLVSQLTNLRFRNHEHIGINMLEISTFFGGEGDEWAPQKDEWIETDDFIIFAYKNDVLVPRGNTPSQHNRILLHPYLYIKDSLWRTSFSAVPLSSKTIELKWDHYPIPAEYIIQRKNTPDGAFETIAVLPYKNLTYTDNNLQPETQYIYRIQVNDIYSNTASVATYPTNPPNPPSNLNASAILKKQIDISWIDNSNNEIGFRVERSENSNTNFVNIASLNYNVHNYSNINLTPNTTYYYRVYAYNEDGNSGYSNVLVAKTLPLDPPDTPSGLSALNITRNSLNLSWIDNSDNEDWFIIEQSTLDDTVFIRIDTVNNEITSYLVNELSPNTTYFYRVIALNHDGYSGYSNIIEVTTLDLQPTLQAPSYLNVSAITKNTISIFWIDNSEYEDGFIIERSFSSEGGFIQVADVDSNITTYTDVDLAPGFTYYYRIKAFNENENSDYSNILETKTLSLNLPDAPSSLRADTVNYEWLTLSWLDVATNESGFRIERTLDTNKGYSFTKDINIPDLTEYTDTGLEYNTTYYYRLAAYNDDGFSNYSNVLKIKTLQINPPNKPTLLSPTRVTLNTITLNWQDNSSNETGFIIKRAIAPDKLFETIKYTEANTISFVDLSLNPNTTYYYQVKAINKAGNSNNSNTAIASTLSHAESKRVWDGLIAYYNFNFNSDNIIYDYSNYGESLNLVIGDTMQIEWNTNNKLELFSNNYIKSINPAIKIVDACKSTNEITIECWIRPSFINSSNPANILTIGSNRDSICASLAQKRIFMNDNKSYKYLIGIKTKATASNGEPYLSAGNEFTYLSLHHVVYVKNKEGIEKLFINGEEAASGIRPEAFENWDNNCYLILGNDMDSGSPWNGIYYTAAIYNIAFTEKQVMINYNAGPKDNLAKSPINYTIDIFPNPSEDIINIKIIPLSENELSQKTMIQIYNLVGDLLFSEIVEDPNKEQVMTLNLSEFDKGIYVLRIITNDHFTTEKFIIY